MLPEDERPERDLESVYAGLPREQRPPSQLEERVTTALRRRGLLGVPPRKKLPIRLAYVAAAVALFFAGAALQALRTPSAPQFDFILFLHEGPEYQHAASSQEGLQRVSEYRAWAQRLRDEGLVISGTKLKDEEKVLGPAGTTRPPGSAVAGYFAIQAPDAATAERIAATCPHLRYGGNIEIRPIDRV